MSEIIRKVVDVTGERHDLVREIGRGGQGVVYEVAGGKYAVKLFENRSASEIYRLDNQLKEVRRIDLQGLPIAKPIRVLRPPYVGYLMELFSGMEPIKNIIYPKNEKSIKYWYIKTGGMRRRLFLLLRIGDILSEVHGKGLVYPDISPNNVFFSASVDANVVGLIDADNIHYMSSPGANDIIYTPGFGAPELVLEKSGVNTLTDAYAFAVLVFQTLTLVNPFIGDLVDEGEADLENAAFMGQLPWIEHSTDRSNETVKGVPRSWVISSGIMRLASRTFEFFLHDPLGKNVVDSNFPPAQQGRPGVMEWTEKLCQAAYSSIECPECGATYYFNQRQCPWCDFPRPSFVLIKTMTWDPEIKSINQQTPFMIGAFSKSSPFFISKRFIYGYKGNLSYEPIIEAQFDEKYIKVRKLKNDSYWLSELDGNNVNDVTPQFRPFHAQPGRASWCLHFGEKEKVHRVALFEVYP